MTDPGKCATPTGLEPATSAVTGRRANQLRYGALGKAFTAYPQRDSNPCYRRERAGSWAARRWGPGSFVLNRTPRRQRAAARIRRGLGKHRGEDGESPKQVTGVSGRVGPRQQAAKLPRVHDPIQRYAEPLGARAPIDLQLYTSPSPR